LANNLGLANNLAPSTDNGSIILCGSAAWWVGGMADGHSGLRRIRRRKRLP
jgi:hypothetical protein